MTGRIQILLQAASNDDHSSISSARCSISDIKQADSAFVELKKKLLDIEEWNKNSALSSFQLFDEAGAPQNFSIAEGLFIRILLKGAGKYDWVKIFKIQETSTELVISVRPTFDPTAETPDRSNVSHFFSSESSNNFCLQKNEAMIVLYVIGLNERQNTAQTKNTLEALRNMVTANLGYYLSIQKNEWDKFCQSFIDEALS